MRDRAFFIPSIISLAFSVIWAIALLSLTFSHNLNGLILSGHVLAVWVPVVISVLMFRKDKWQAACGSLSVSIGLVSLAMLFFSAFNF
jgi:hypothetical protein